MNQEALLQAETTAIFRRIERGDSAAAAELLPVIYGELRSLAQKHMTRERSDHTLQATALVHEAYLKLVGPGMESYQNRAHFFRTAANAMRQVLVDHARGRATDKRGGGKRRIEIEEELAVDEDRLEDILALDDAVQKLKERDEELAKIVELRFYAGLTNEEVAEVLGCVTRTVERGWRTARAFLQAELDGA